MGFFTSIRYFEDALELALQIIDEEFEDFKDDDNVREYVKKVRERIGYYLDLAKERKFEGLKSVLRDLP